MSFTGNLLFTLTGKNALFEKTEGGGLRAVYALVKQVVQDPWPGALPDDETLSEAFVDTWLAGLGDLIEQS